jgi:hypothetical protein
MLKKFLTGTVLFGVVGIPASYQIMTIFGLASNYFAIAGIALVFSLLLMFRNILLLFLVILVTMAINLPEEVLFEYGIDRIVLIGLLLIMVVFPSVHKMMSA